MFDQRPPWSVSIHDDDYQEQAARSLTVNGFCVLRGPVLPPKLCERCCSAIWQRLDALLRAAHGQGLDIDSGLLRFNEICKRQPGARYDLRLPLGAATAHVPFAASVVPDSDTWMSIWPLVDALVVPILRLTAMPMSMRRCASWNTEVAGCVVALPGAPDQPSHLDGDEIGLINAFLPLVEVTEKNGPTELQPGSHLDPEAAMPSDPYAPLPSSISPTMAVGDLLLFHYRCIHRGTGNQSDAGRPVLYFTYGADGAVDAHNFPTDIPLMPSPDS